MNDHEITDKLELGSAILKCKLLDFKKHIRRSDKMAIALVVEELLKHEPELREAIDGRS